MPANPDERHLFPFCQDSSLQETGPNQQDGQATDTIEFTTDVAAAVALRRPGLSIDAYAPGRPF
jgi:hypothetical protein